MLLNYDDLRYERCDVVKDIIIDKAGELWGLYNSNSPESTIDKLKLNTTLPELLNLIFFHRIQ